MNITEEFLISEGIFYEKEVDLKKRTWIHRGGKAGLFVIPANTAELERVISFLYKNNIKHLLIGATSNLYILNTTNIPVVVSTLKCNTYQLNGGVIECDCGVQVGKLSRKMVDEGIKGFEYLTKLPGTVGAAIYNNSSVKNETNSISELLIDLDLLTPAGIERLKKEDIHFSFRSSDLKEHVINGVILRTRLIAEPGVKAELEAAMRRNEHERDLLLEGPSQNLGCTVHLMFSNGTMPSKYRIPYRAYSKILNFFVKDKLRQKRSLKNFLLTISGHKQLIPYVSDRQLITYLWKDEGADLRFDEYLHFMRDVCKTDKIEIEVIK